VFQETTYDDRALTRYLLGQLAGEEADRLDELAIVDDEVAWRVREIENDLVDAYVRRMLDDTTRQQFETHYLASPKRRAKVQFAERFVRAVDVLGYAPAERRRPGRRRWWQEWLVPRRPSVGWGFAYGAAALLLMVATGLLLMRGMRIGPEPVAKESTQARGAATAPAASPSSSAPAASSSPVVPPRASPSPESSPESAGSPAMVALVLWPQTRGVSEGADAGGVTAPTVAVPAGVDRVALQLQIESPDFVRYSATLKESATNRIVWRADRLTAPTSAERLMVPVAIPANLLKPGAYVLELTGYGAVGGDDMIGSYVFQVARR